MWLFIPHYTLYLYFYVTYPLKHRENDWRKKKLWWLFIAQYTIDVYFYVFTHSLSIERMIGERIRECGYS